MANPIPDAEALETFRKGFLYGPDAFLVDRVVHADAESKTLEAELDTGARNLPYASHQRVGPTHPAHVAAGDLVMATGSLGCVHGWLFHDVRFDAGWTAFGSRIHRADFKELARLGPPLRLRCQETRARVGPKRVVLRLEFRFEQEGKLVYAGDQSAFFLLEPELG
ncbi:MAG: hypothetical protein QNK05_25700 [Myxococcota bacterium]|nr:hypothetical protein [Myxococcota bacterium]